MNAVFRALADPTRSAGEIAQAFDVAWPTISRHLGVLREAGLVVAERDGQYIRYELNTSVMQDFVEHLLEWSGSGRRHRAT
jgi:ArsR family transcriptional regulator